jgi:pimeloyl-ACP methyl ester carboxylesterase
MTGTGVTIQARQGPEVSKHMGQSAWPRMGRIASLAVLLACTAILASCSQQQAAESSASPSMSRLASSEPPVVRPSVLVDKRVLVGQSRLHARCAGSGSSTVLLIPGYGDDIQSWAKVEPSASKLARVCSYERLGEGTSDQPAGVQTFASQAKQLRQLLTALGQPGPYVVVGHSVGGPVAVTFASLYRPEVRGLLLLDGTPPGWPAALCRVKPTATGGGSSFVAACAQQTNPAQNKERLNGRVAYAEAARIGTLSGLPLLADTAVNTSYADAGLAPADVAKTKDAWLAGQRHWVSLSSKGQLVSVTSSHYIQLDRPDLVLTQIRQLVTGSHP